MKPGDLVEYHKSNIWDPPHDIRNGTVGVIVEELSLDRGHLDYHIVKVLIDGGVRSIPKNFLQVINETR
jgi:predicted AAA+ superfamily ATPase